MTDEQLEKANGIRNKISECENILKELNSDEYDHFVIRGVASDGVSDYIDLIPKECLQAVKQWYADEWIKLKEEFKVL